MIGQAKNQPGKAGNPKSQIGKFIGVVIVDPVLVQVYVLFDLPADGEHIILRLQKNFQRGLIRRTVGPGF